MINRIKRAVKAFREPEPQTISLVDENGVAHTVEIGGITRTNYQPLGDGKAELLTDMTEEEYQEYVRDEENGWKKFKTNLGL